MRSLRKSLSRSVASADQRSCPAGVFVRVSSRHSNHERILCSDRPVIQPSREPLSFASCDVVPFSMKSRHSSP